MSAQYEELQEKEKSIKKIVENMGHWCIEEETKMANTYMKKKINLHKEKWDFEPIP